MSKAKKYNIYKGNREMKKERTYSIDVRSLYPEFDDYFNTSKKFGYFSEDGKEYTITDCKTPRQWMNVLFNDKFGAICANRGEGFTAFGRFNVRVTRYYNSELYLVRELDGKRTLVLRDEQTGETLDLFADDYVTNKVRPGCSEFIGEQMGIKYSVRVFVPREINCECWLVNLENTGKTARKLTLWAGQTWVFHNNSCWGKQEPCKDVQLGDIENGFVAGAHNLNKPFDDLYGAFAMSNCTNKYKQTKSEKTRVNAKRDPAEYKDFTYNFVNLYSIFDLAPGEKLSRSVVSAADETEQAVLDASARLVDVANAEKEYEKTTNYFEKEFSYNTCSLPDKNFERFLNTWLKYQVAMTYIYNRAEYNGGYRDVLQDSWGAMLISPEHAIGRTIEALNWVYPDGHGIRSFDSNGGISLREHFVDCPLWAHCSFSQYIKETGDFSVLEKEVGYLNSDERGTVEEHLWRMLEYPYTHRGENGLVLMYDGDWLDGLTGINQNGTATSAWATMQAFWAQNHMADIYEAWGKPEKAKILRERSAEYKRIVRDVAWDGKWYVYGFKSDGLPVGSSKCAEAKIYLNPNTWAIFTGIEDDEKRIEQIRHSIFTYLQTPYGSLLNYPPYVNDLTCGRIGSQVPGTFANSAVYLHAASFEVFAKTKLKKTEEAHDLFMRLLPNHIDNPDSRRTSEPFCTGNVHYGPNNERFGMNLFSWFTATPAWMIHGGFDEILGVKAEFDGLLIEPCVPDDWNEYSVKRTYRGKEYFLNFKKSDDKKGVFVGDEKISENKISLENTADTFDIYY